MLYYLVGSRELDGGLMCTASHNPKAYTGAKLVKRGRDRAVGRRRDRRRPRDGSRTGWATPPGGGSVEEVDDLRRVPARRRCKFIDPSAIKPLRVVVDGGNGMAGPMVGPLLERLGLDLIEAYWKPDGNFPDHEPNPLLPENREFIMREVVEQRAPTSGSPGTATPTAASSSTSTGAFVDGDFLTALLAESMLRKHPGATILYDVRASRAVADTVERAGGRALMNRVGHAFFKTRMREEDARLRRRGVRPLLLPRLLLRRLGHDPGAADPRAAVAREAHACPSCSSPTARATSSPARSTPRSPTSTPRSRSSPSATPTRRQHRLDGISVDYDDWHFNVRPSNTEPLLRLCLESLRSREDMERRRDEVLGVIRS